MAHCCETADDRTLEKHGHVGYRISIGIRHRGVLGVRVNPDQSKHFRRVARLLFEFPESRLIGGLPDLDSSPW